MTHLFKKASMKKVCIFSEKKATSIQKKKNKYPKSDNTMTKKNVFVIMKVDWHSFPKEMILIRWQNDSKEKK